MTPLEYLKKPYGRVVVPESDGTFRAEIIEFPGCIADGNTRVAALSNLESVAESWLEATIAKGLPVPEPLESDGFSGKLVVRLGKGLHKRAAHMAAREGISLNQFIISSVAERVGNHSVRVTLMGGVTGISHVTGISGLTMVPNVVVQQLLGQLSPTMIPLGPQKMITAPELVHAGS